MKRYFSLILAIAATVSAQIVPSTGNVRGPTSATDNAVARYDGTTGKLVQNSAVMIDDSGNTTAADVILGSSGPSVKSTLSARAPRQGLVFDGTFGASFSGVPAFGTGDFTVSAWINPSTLATVGIIAGGTSSFSLRFQSNGTLNVGKVNVSDGTPSTGAVSAGKFSHVSYVKSGSTGTYYINGISSGTSSETGLDYSAATTLVGAYSSSTTQAFSGTISGGLIYNRALSASEVVALYEAGAPAGADYNSASSTTLLSGTFENGIGGGTYAYSTFSGASATGFTATSTSTSYKTAVSPTAFSVVKGRKYRLTYTLTLNSGTAPKASIGDPSNSSYMDVEPTLVAGTNTIEFTCTTTASNAKLNFWVGAVSDFAISGVALIPLGLLLAPDAAQAGGGYVWNDQSGNLAQIVLPSSGVQWNLPSVAGQRIRGTTSTNGNQQLLGASVLLPAECQITHVRARARSGTPTITIGTASGGAQIVASVALSTTWLNCTIALTGGIVSSADDIWVGSNSTDVVEIDIAYQPLKL